MVDWLQAWTVSDVRTNLYQVQDSQLTFGAVNDEHEIERSVTPVYDSPPFVWAVSWSGQELFQLRSIEKVAKSSWPRDDEGVYLLDERLRGLVKWRVELCQTGYARCVDWRICISFKAQGKNKWTQQIRTAWIMTEVRQDCLIYV
jgi:hypothetical protein